MARITKLMKGKVLVSGLERGMSMTKGGIILTDDNMSETGVRTRWAKIHMLADNIDDMVVGEYVLLEHGRWTNKIKIQDDNGDDVDVWYIDYPSGVLLVGDHIPDDRTDLQYAPDRKTILAGH